MMERIVGVAPLLAAALQGGDAAWPVSPRVIVIAALALVALMLLVKAARCALRLVALAVLAAVAILAWRWFV